MLSVVRQLFATIAGTFCTLFRILRTTIWAELRRLYSSSTWECYPLHQGTWQKRHQSPLCQAQGPTRPRKRTQVLTDWPGLASSMLASLPLFPLLSSLRSLICQAGSQAVSFGRKGRACPLVANLSCSTLWGESRDLWRESKPWSSNRGADSWGMAWSEALGSPACLDPTFDAFHSLKLYRQRSLEMPETSRESSTCSLPTNHGRTARAWS